jgi:predicted NAD-dependent protein-ADP-ribosyltransferase YbiA (DUF1768 family)
MEMGAEEETQREMVFRAKETLSSEILAVNGQSLAENDEAKTDDTSNRRTQPEIDNTKHNDARVEESASAIEEHDKAAKKAARRAGRIARTAKAAIQAKKEQAERGRLAESRRVTFDVHRARLVDGVEQDMGYIFFNSGVKRYGGPFAFLSNSYPSEFRVEEVHRTHSFVTVEQFYQYCKTMSFRLAPEVFVVHTEGFAALSSHQVCNLVLTVTGSAPSIAGFFRNFMSCATEQHLGWSKPWEKYWTPAIPKFLEQGLQAKFAADENLMDLLQKTGNYELVKASKDKILGVGFAAEVAFDHRDEWQENEDCNLLGRALMKVRDASRGSAHSEVFDREYYDDQELEFWSHVCWEQSIMRY